MHVIRLRGPWEKQSLDGQDTLRIAVPEQERDDEVEGDASDSGAEYRRNFNQPTGLGPDDRVLLRVSEWQGTLEDIRVNEQPVKVSPAPLEADITALLARHNQVVLRLKADSHGNARLSGEVTLAIDAD